MERNMGRGSFIKSCMAATAGLLCNPSVVSGDDFLNSPIVKKDPEAQFFESNSNGVRCLLCPNQCVIKNGSVGFCGVRKAKDGTLHTLSYGNPCSVNIDPIEKKPLNHFLPGTKAFSIATAGCNLRCLNCQNWMISQTTPNKTVNYDLMPDDVVAKAIASKCDSIAYTYTEPVTFYEYVYDTAKKAKDKGIRNVVKSSGYINTEPLKKWCEVIDAANIDLKSFNDETYKKMSKARLQPVLDTLKILKGNGIWLEITHLTIPSWTDDLDEMEQMCKWLVSNGFSDTPIHFSRFYPLYKLEQLPPTPLETLEKAYQIATSAGLKYVYTANVPGKEHSSTHCPHCGMPVIHRQGFTVTEKHMKANRCEKCGAEIAGVYA